MKPITHFLGMNNRRPPYDLATDDGRYVADALDMEFDNAGAVRSGRSVATLGSATNAHSVFMVSDTIGFVMLGAVLNALDVSSAPAFTPLSTLSSAAPVSYLLAENGAVYFSNGTDAGQVVNGAVYPMGLPRPAEPALLPTPIGAMRAGGYQVAIRYINANTGDIGPLSPSGVATLSDMGGIMVALPGATPGATHVQVFCTTANGSVTYLQQIIVASATSISLATVSAEGESAPDGFFEPLPAGTELCEYLGRMLLASGTKLFYSPPYRHGYRHAASGEIDFGENVQSVVPNQSVLYVVLETKTVAIFGDVEKPEQPIKDVLFVGGPKASGFTHPNQAVVGWFTPVGFVLADDQGQVKPVMAEAVSIANLAARMPSIVFDDRDYRCVANPGYTLNLTTGAAARNTLACDSYSRGLATANGHLIRFTTSPVVGTLYFGRENFGTDSRKHLRAVWIGVECEDAMLMRVVTDEQDFEYNTRRADAALRTQRFDPGRGLKANWFDIYFTNESGAAFKLASILFDPVTTTRKI